MNHKKIEELIKQIKYHRDLYYNKQPKISDAKFDAIEDELRQLDPNNPLLHKIGVDSSELFNKKEHIIPMMSQDKVMTPADFKKWSKKRNINEFIVQYKLDGISIELQYKNGVFDCALTRGDGIIRDDVSVNVMKMNGFLPRLTSNFTGAIRGEVLMFHDIYSKKYKDKQNCRNAAAGIVRRKDGLGNEDLNVIFYDAISMNDEIDYKTELEKVAWLKQENFPCVDAKMMKSQERVIKFRQEVMDVL